MKRLHQVILATVGSFVASLILSFVGAVIKPIPIVGEALAAVLIIAGGLLAIVFFIGCIILFGWSLVWLLKSNNGMSDNPADRARETELREIRAGAEAAEAGRMDAHKRYPGGSINQSVQIRRPNFRKFPRMP